ncbi:hypothetical protein I317_02286 [Kwoniella heveanensis CBS 569]|uniref:Uncharacterized protein n=1 Tax=Kwoniella heveanensis BCC8398 TaxID=1296120 RepID=A0A1B9GW10_9TREE|nr:hypothetical protein I316_03242 [Kwoniella heveanensis BCC8398]OCF43844.1 hypothetical protein I317_02286 [Kwoniella heveanensis CBS 569]
MPNEPLFASQQPATQLLLHSSLKYAQLTSMVVPPLYVLRTLVLRRKPFSIKGLMHTSIGGAAVGGVIGAGLGYGEQAVGRRLERIRSDASQIRTNDYSIISATLSALLIPALFLKRAPLPSLVLGGASIGLGVGVWARLGEKIGKGQGLRAEDVTGDVPGVGDAVKKV